MKTGSYWLHGLGKKIAGSDIVVAPQELQCLNVPYLWMRREQICNAWIWWGHGYNFQAAVRPSLSTGIKEGVKRFMTRRADGLITYTERGADYWRTRGFHKDHVTPYYNTIDVEGLRRVGAEISDAQRLDLRRKLMLEGKCVLLFSGRLYAEKKVDFLIRAVALLKASRPDVALLIIGDGEERDRLYHLAKELELQDVHFLGEVVTPKDTAGYFSLADLMVIPGLVGLAIVHGFAFGLPLITTDFPGHSPEIEYLTESNGIMTAMDTQGYAKTLEMLLSSPEKLEAMKRSAMATGDELQLGRSVHRFLDGVRSISANSL
jgi:glycosyltransferase involved in cell wall biosynthesis